MNSPLITLDCSSGQVHEPVGRLVVRGNSLGDLQQLHGAALRRANVRAGPGELQPLVPEHQQSHQHLQQHQQQRQQLQQREQRATPARPATAESLPARTLPHDEQMLESEVGG